MLYAVACYNGSCYDGPDCISKGDKLVLVPLLLNCFAETEVFLFDIHTLVTETTKGTVSYHRNKYHETGLNDVQVSQVSLWPGEASMGLLPDT